MNNAIDSYNIYISQHSESSESNWGLGILIGTRVVWLLTLLVITPITNRVVNQKLSMLQGENTLQGSTEEVQERLNQLYEKAFIKIDCIILGIAGFILGITAGWVFIGIAWKKSSWPGLLVFIGSSVLGCYIHG